MAEDPEKLTRREFFAKKARVGGMVLLGGAISLAHPHAASATTVWQIDPSKCTQCGKCATLCVLEPSAVKCVHAFTICGYCELCFGFFEAQPNDLNTGAENQRCPTGALQRKYIEDPYYEYHIDKDLCIGCAKCVEGCSAFGNGSLFLQVNHDICVHCNQCSIARGCPSEAFVRVPSNHPYLLKNGEQSK